MHAVLRRVFGPRADLTPSDSLYRRLLPRLSADHLAWGRCAWIRATRPAKDTVPVAVDGKTLRGARSVEQAAPQWLTFCTYHTYETLMQVPVGERTNEISVAQATAP